MSGRSTSSGCGRIEQKLGVVVEVVCDTEKPFNTLITALRGASWE